MKNRVLAGAAAGVLALAAGCGGAPHPAGPPKAAALAARLGCRVTGPEQAGGTVATYDTVQYVAANGSSCAGATFDNFDDGIIIMTFASEAKETDWLHQNAAAMTGSSGGYTEVVSGHLWAVAYGGFGVFSASEVISKIGGKDSAFF
jgi:hypothetical protein